MIDTAPEPLGVTSLHLVSRAPGELVIGLSGTGSGVTFQRFFTQSRTIGERASLARATDLQHLVADGAGGLFAVARRHPVLTGLLDPLLVTQDWLPTLLELDESLRPQRHEMRLPPGALFAEGPGKLRQSVSGRASVQIVRLFSLRGGEFQLSAAQAFDINRDLPIERIAPGEIFWLMVPGIGVDEENPTPVNGRYPTSAAGIQVRIDGRAAPILAVHRGFVQIAAPFDLQSYSAIRAEILASGRETIQVPLTVVPAAPKMLPAVVRMDGTTQGLVPAGDTFLLFGTGFGRLAGAITVGEVAASLLSPEIPVTLSYGEYDLIYAGTTPGLPPGLLQFNLRTRNPDPFPRVTLRSGREYVSVPRESTLFLFLDVPVPANQAP